MTLTQRFHLLIWIVAQAFFACQAQAAEGGKSFAQVWRVHGSVTATSATPPTHARGLKVGDTVYVGELLQAAVQGEAVLRLEDGGYMALRPGAQFVVEDFAADQSGTDHITVRLVQGGLRLVTGWIGKLNPKGYRVRTPSATIGIRGTDHDAYYLPETLAREWSQKSGSYDKVASGQTYLQTQDGSVDIAPGQVGFVRAVPAAKTRALMTLLLPVLLDTVPEFYVPGQFDAELDQLSPAAAPVPGAQPLAPQVGQAPAAASAAVPTVSARLPDGSCNAVGVARAWLDQLDGALGRKDASHVLSLFAAGVQIRAVVNDAAGASKTLTLDRQEFASSTIAALKTLSDYSQRRLSVSAEPLDAVTCDAVSVKSAVVEQGKQNGKPYRFEALEEYRLVQTQGQWLATEAASRQR